MDLNSLVRSVADSFRPQMEERQHEVTLSLPDRPLPILGDPTRLDQVVVNLLSNAAKYTPEGGQVWLTVEAEGTVAVVRVRDNGMGIDSGLLPYIFDLFSQGDRVLDRTQGGLGIGLALVKNLVEMHGGTVTAHSEGPGQGSEFTIRLPSIEAMALQPQQPEPLSEGPAGSAASCPLRVLMVDDNADTRKLFGSLLARLGNQVRTAQDGSSALETAQEFRPEVVLLDLGLPGMDGYEVARRMRQELVLQDAVLVAVTGYGQESDRQRTEEAGFDHHLVKPVGIDALRQLLKKIAEAAS